VRARTEPFKNCSFLRNLQKIDNGKIQLHPKSECLFVPFVIIKKIRKYHSTSDTAKLSHGTFVKSVQIRQNITSGRRL